MSNLPEIIDLHVHLCRDTAQEKLVFTKRGWPDEWDWGSPDKVIPYMDHRGVSHVATMNIIEIRRMISSRMARLPAGLSEAEIANTRESYLTEMRERVSNFNDWACGVYKGE